MTLRIVQHRCERRIGQGGIAGDLRDEFFEIVGVDHARLPLLLS